MITIQSQAIIGTRTASRVEARLYSSKFWQTASGKYHGVNDPGSFIFSKRAYMRWDCTVSSGIPTIPQISLEPTTNALKGSDVLLTMALFDQDNGRMVGIVLKDFRVPVTPATTSWAVLGGAVVAPPAQPAAPTATAISSTQVDVVITSMSGVLSFKLQRSVNGGAFADLAPATGLSAGTYHDTGLTASNSYAYKVIASNFGGDSPASAASNTVITPAIPDQWLKADALSLANNAAIATWTASAGSNATQGTGANQPLFKTNQVNSLPAVLFDGSNDTLGFTAMTTIRTGIYVVKHDLTGLNATEPVIVGHATGTDFVGWSGTELLDRTGNTAGKILAGATWVNGISMDPQVVPKAVSTFQVIAVRTATNASADNLGSDRGTSFFKGLLAEVQLFTTALTDAQIVAQSQSLMTKYGLSVLPIVVLDGDSITASAPQFSAVGWWNGAIQGNDTWGAQIVPLLTNSGFGAFTLINVAKGGQTSTDLNSDVSTEVVPLFSATRPSKTALVMIGTNDLLATGDSAATIFGRITTYCQTVKTAGATKVILATVIPNAPANDTRRNALNVLIRGGHASYDAVADLAADSRLDDSSDLIYFQSDAIHLNVSGQAAVADVFSQAVWTAYGITPPVVPPPTAGLWLKADTITGHVDGDTLANGFVWADSSGNGKDAVVHAGFNPVLYKTNILNGLPAVRLNVPYGFGNAVAYLDYPSITHRTIFVVVKYNPATFSDYIGLITGQDTLGTNSGFVVIAEQSTTKMGWGGNTAFLKAYRNGTAIPFTGGVGHDFAPINVYWIGSYIVPTAQTFAGRIGYGLVGGRQWEGDFLEIKIFDTVLTDAQRHTEEAALGTKYGVTMAVQ